MPPVIKKVDKSASSAKPRAKAKAKARAQPAAAAAVPATPAPKFSLSLLRQPSWKHAKCAVCKLNMGGTKGSRAVVAEVFLETSPMQTFQHRMLGPQTRENHNIHSKHSAKNMPNSTK